MTDRLYRFVFGLPPIFALSAQTGRHQPCVHGCVLELNAAGQVEITGASPDMVIEQAQRFLRIVGKGHGAETIDAIMFTPPTDGMRGARDSWTIFCNARIAFTSSSVRCVLFNDAGERIERALPAPDRNKARALQLVT